MKGMRFMLFVLLVAILLSYILFLIHLPVRQQPEPKMELMESHANGSQPAEFVAYLENQLKITQNVYSTMNWA